MADQGQVKTDELDAQEDAKRRLALAQIRQYPDPVLRLEAQEVVEFDGDLQQLVEPAIVDRSSEVDEDDEGCLSMQGVVVPVERPVHVRIEARDAEGNPVA